MDRKYTEMGESSYVTNEKCSCFMTVNVDIESRVVLIPFTQRLVIYHSLEKPQFAEFELIIHVIPRWWWRIANSWDIFHAESLVGNNGLPFKTFSSF